MAAIARESSGIMHHLVVQHLQRRTEAEADKKSLYRPEALELASPPRPRGRAHRAVAGLGQPHVSDAARRDARSRLCFAIVRPGADLLDRQRRRRVPGHARHRRRRPARSTRSTCRREPARPQGRRAREAVKSPKEEPDLAPATETLEKARSSRTSSIGRTSQSRKQLVAGAQPATARAGRGRRNDDPRAAPTARSPTSASGAGAAVQFGDPILHDRRRRAPSPRCGRSCRATIVPRLTRGQELQVELAGLSEGVARTATIYDVGRDVDRRRRGPQHARPRARRRAQARARTAATCSSRRSCRQEHVQDQGQDVPLPPRHAGEDGSARREQALPRHAAAVPREVRSMKGNRP